MEFALENIIPFSARVSFIAGSVKMRFTPVCASSKLPSMAHTATFSPSWVVIWVFCIALTPFCG